MKLDSIGGAPVRTGACLGRSTGAWRHPSGKRLTLLPGVHRRALASASPAHDRSVLANRRRVARASTFPAGSRRSFLSSHALAGTPVTLQVRQRTDRSTNRNARWLRRAAIWQGGSFHRPSGSAGLLATSKPGDSEERRQAPGGAAVCRAEHLRFGEDPRAERGRASASLRVFRAAACLRAPSARVRRRPRLAPSEATVDRQDRRAKHGERHGPPRACPPPKIWASTC